jgi:CHRD domain-containing protein
MFARLALSALAAGLTTLGCGDYNSPTSPGTSTNSRFTASLAGDAERPTPVTTTASGSATFSTTTRTTTGPNDPYNPGSGGTTSQKTITYSVLVSGLTGPATAAHIHGPADEGNAADVIVPLAITSSAQSGTVVSGSFTATANANVTMDSLLVLMRNGFAYVNVHTAAHPDGEIRGQIRLP